MPTNTTMRHCYLFVLEVEPMEVGKAYDELPLHCTLMPRFWIGISPHELAHKVRPLFSTTGPLLLTTHKRTTLGPQQKNVSLVELTPELDELNMQLYKLLNKLDVTYDNPEWVGGGHIFHITDKEEARLEVGSKQLGKAIYLVEVRVPGQEHKRVISEEFQLK